MLLVRNKSKIKRVKFKRKAIKNAETLDKQLASHAKKKKKKLQNKELMN